MRRRLRTYAGLLCLLAIAHACGSDTRPVGNPLSPTPVPDMTSLSGHWIGTAQVLTCDGPACSPWVTYPGPPRPFSLVVLDQGMSVEALLDIDVRVHLNVELTGERQEDGSVIFTGGSRPPEALDSRTAEVDGFVIQRDPATGLAGTFQYRVMWKTGSRSPVRPSAARGKASFS